MPPKRVLSVGQCGADHPAISRMIRQHFDAEVEPADSFDGALRKLRHPTRRSKLAGFLEMPGA